MASGTLSVGGIGAAVIGLIAGALIAFFLFYMGARHVGMKTGYPLYIVGTSTFGDKGGYFLPGLFMGALQVGWYSVGTYFATKFVLNFIMGPANAPDPAVGGFSIVFTITGIIWGYLFAYVGVKGIDYVAKISTYLPIVPFLMLLYAVIAGSGGLSSFDVKTITSVDPNSVSARL